MFGQRKMQFLDRARELIFERIRNRARQLIALPRDRRGLGQSVRGRRRQADRALVGRTEAKMPLPDE